MDALRSWAGRVLPRRLGRQLQWMVALSLTLTLVVFGAHTIAQQTALALADIENQAAALARGTALASVEPMLTDELDVMEQLVLHSARLPQVLDLALFTRQGTPVARAQRTRGADVKAVYDAPGTRALVPALPQPASHSDKEQSMVVAWHPVVAGTHVGWVRVTIDAQMLLAIRERIWLSTLAVGLAAGLASLLLLSRLLEKPMRAIGRARDFAVGLQHIGGQQLEQLEGSEETRALGQALNQASARLFQQRQSIDDSFAALVRQEAARAEANEQLRTIFALSPDALVSFDVQGHVKFANEAFFRITGLPPAQVLDQPAQVVDAQLRALCATPDEYPGLEALFQSEATVPADGPADALPPAPARMRLTLERPRHAVLDVVGLRGESLAVSRLLYLRDITHETEVERMKSAFLHTAAHELRTPMTAIHSCVELLLLREFEPPRRRQLLDIVQRHSKTLIHIVNELLDLARLEARNSGDFEFEDVCLSDVVQQAVGDFVAPEGRAAPELQTEGPAGSLRVHVDVRKLKQVVGNLLSNAYKYSHQGPVCVRVRADAAMPGLVGFEIQDQGIGLTAEQLARVGERFYRADASGQVLGTGLGMSIVSEMVALMKGQLSKASVPGQGSTFGVWFTPLALPKPAAPAGSAAPLDHEKSPHVEDARALSAV